MAKFFNTVGMLCALFMARTFGDYIHSIGGPDVASGAVYRYRGKLWFFPTSAIDTPISSKLDD